MPVVIRVRWANGYVDVVGAGGGTRRTIPFDAANAKTEAAAREIGEAVLAEQGVRPLRSTNARLAATPSWPALGDKVATYGLSGAFEVSRLVERRVSITETSHAILEPTIRSKADQFLVRNQLLLRKLTSGGLGGRSQAGELLQSQNTGIFTGQMSEQTPLEWSSDGLVAGSMSPKRVLNEDSTLVRLQMLMTKNSDTNVPQTLPNPITVSLWINDSPIGPITFPANTVEWNMLAAGWLPVGTSLKVGIVSTTPNTIVNLNNKSLSFTFYTVTGSFVNETRTAPEVR